MGVSLGARATAAAALLSLGLGSPAAAQMRSEAPDPVSARRERLDRLAGVVQRRLGLTDAQAARLQATSARYGRQRRQLLRTEVEARRSVRAEVARGPDADQARVRAALDALISSQQRRAALLAEEQAALAAFLTPVQRAQYLGLQERAARAAQRLRGARRGVGGPDSLDGAGRPGFRRGTRPF